MLILDTLSLIINYNFSDELREKNLLQPNGRGEKKSQQNCPKPQSILKLYRFFYHIYPTICVLWNYLCHCSQLGPSLAEGMGQQKSDKNQ